MKDRHLSIRISEDLYKSYIKKALKRGNEEERIVKVSEIIREVLENNK